MNSTLAYICLGALAMAMFLCALLERNKRLEAEKEKLELENELDAERKKTRNLELKYATLALENMSNKNFQKIQSDVEETVRKEFQGTIVINREAKENS